MLLMLYTLLRDTNDLLAAPQLIYPAEGVSVVHQEAALRATDLV
jgi:hypothetical protein